ncbi:hypothetical protein PS9374_01935 [Planomonospora sphaerica]|uniref:Uncharacterized protein n=1 Tax=Planomonospora sphaerica TaxID=161355 RepID=A0A161LK89_9ACTN|nr:hypothetical protein [Planomonospora sphaerica]GAT66287.1 hypothetical protein PS9374_01935 [Planomonospora sphaerica]
MIRVHGLPPDPRPRPARPDRASRRSQPGGGLGLASLLAGGAAVLAGFVPAASGASAPLVLVSVALGFAALGMAHHPAVAADRAAGGPGRTHGRTLDRGDHRTGVRMRGRGHDGGHGRAGGGRTGWGRGQMDRGRTGWASLVLELSAGALLVWSAVAFLTVVADPGAARLDGPDRVRGGPAAGCVREAGDQPTCEAGAVQVLQ